MAFNSQMSTFSDILVASSWYQSLKEVPHEGSLCCPSASGSRVRFGGHLCRAHLLGHACARLPCVRVVHADTHTIRFLVVSIETVFTWRVCSSVFYIYFKDGGWVADVLLVVPSPVFAFTAISAPRNGLGHVVLRDYLRSLMLFTSKCTSLFIVYHCKQSSFLFDFF